MLLLPPGCLRTHWCIALAASGCAALADFHITSLTHLLYAAAPASASPALSSAPLYSMPVPSASMHPEQAAARRSTSCRLRRAGSYPSSRQSSSSTLRRAQQVCSHTQPQAGSARACCQCSCAGLVPLMIKQQCASCPPLKDACRCTQQPLRQADLMLRDVLSQCALCMQVLTRQRRLR